MGLYIYDYEVAPGKTIYLRLAHHHDILHASFLVPAGSDNQHNDSPKPPLRASIIAYYKKAKCWVGRESEEEKVEAGYKLIANWYMNVVVSETGGQ